MENIAFVLGNGTSRLALDLNQLKQTGIVYGCNALYREFSPHVLISTDPGISTEIQESGYPLTHIHYTRKPIAGSGSKKIEHNFGFSSGPIALTYAANSDVERIYIAGFDLVGLDSGKFNNVYAGTEHYKAKDANETYYGNWAEHTALIMKQYKNKRFIRLADNNAHTPNNWKLPNYEDMPIADFLLWINKINPR
jgi:hypothetical protein